MEKKMSFCMVVKGDFFCGGGASRRGKEKEVMRMNEYDECILYIHENRK
jgi:hypothetical protein